MPIRAKRRRIAAGSRAASRAARSRRSAFVNFLQNHDQIGNRALGDRLEAHGRRRGDRGGARHHAARADAARCCSWARNGDRQTPFPFFCDFKGDLADAVRKGRRKEFAEAYAKYGDEIPDPLAEATFHPPCSTGMSAMSRRRSERLALVQELLAIRAARDRPASRRRAFRRRRNAADDGLLTAHWRLGDGATLRFSPTCRIASANASDDIAREPRSGAASWATSVPPWSVLLAHRRAMMPPAIPIATYRLQLISGFQFR